VAKKYTPDELIEAEIDRLIHSDAVKLAKCEIRIKNKRRQYMYQLRAMEKRGKQLMADGWTAETLELLYQNIPEDQE
jgi:hypothetical protein